MITTHQAEVTLPSDREVKVSRSFNAPVALVYRAHTEPELVKVCLIVCAIVIRVNSPFSDRIRCPVQ